MSGRFEHQMEINKKTKEGLEGYPEILKTFYRKSSGLQASSRNIIIGAVKRYFDYNKNNGINTEADSWLCDVTAEDIYDYIESIKVKTLKGGKKKVLSDSTIATTVNYLDTFFSFLVKQHIIKDNPAEEAKEYFPKYKVKKTVTYMTPEEVGIVKERIIRESDKPKRDLCIFMLGCRTGLRRSAITEIDINDIDFDEMKIQVVEKGNVYKDVIIDPDTIRLIQECIKERGEIPGNDALFVTAYKERITARFMRRFFEKYAIDLNKRITPHKMRATCATNLYLQTGDIYIVADRLGHSNIENTKRYTDTVDKGREAAKIMGQLF